jgi:DNA-directed RNA polymerase specialized sigma24 family protein
LVHEAFVALASQRRPPANPTAWLFTTVRNAARSADRKAAELQLIEALRDHVAKRGSAPRDLSALQLPAPLDPATGNPFGYSGNANTITIDAQIPKDGRDRAEQHYVITLEK